MGSADMSKRAHWMLRLAAVGLIGVAAWFPRSSAPVAQLQASQALAAQAHAATAAGAVEARTVHATVAAR